MICALAEVGLAGFFPFAIFYNLVNYFIIIRNMTVFIIVILQTRKKLSVTWSEMKAPAFEFETFRVYPYPEICYASLHLQDYIAVEIYEDCMWSEFPDDFGDAHSPRNWKAVDMHRPIVPIIHRIFGALAEDLPASLQQSLMVGVV